MLIFWSITFYPFSCVYIYIEEIKMGLYLTNNFTRCSFSRPRIEPMFPWSGNVGLNHWTAREGPDQRSL